MALEKLINKAKRENITGLSELVEVMNSFRKNNDGVDSNEFTDSYLNQCLYIDTGVDEDSRYSYKLTNAQNESNTKNHRENAIINYFQNLVRTGEGSFYPEELSNSVLNKKEEPMKVYPYITKNVSLALGVESNEETNETKIHLYFNDKDLLKIYNSRSKKFSEEIQVLSDVFELAGYSSSELFEPASKFSKFKDRFYDKINSLNLSPRTSRNLAYVGIIPGYDK